MRCPTCGTENEANSRFCGGCGARIGQQEGPRLAPTHKITDDAPYPPQAAGAGSAVGVGSAGIGAGPVSYAPPSIPPPASQAPVSQPPSAHRPVSQPPAQPSAARAQVSTVSASFTVPPRRPLGLMVVLLVIDLGLAAAGAVLLSKGLAHDEPRSDANAEPAPADQKTEAPASAAASTQIGAAQAPPASPPPAAAPVPVVAAPAPVATPAPTTIAPAARKDATKQRDDKKPAAKPATSKLAGASVTTPATNDDAKRIAPVTSEPQDPYGSVDTVSATTPDPAREIDAAAARSKPTFDRCASAHGPAQGSIEIAFQVRPDGRIANAAAVANSTGSTELARCLVAEISSWRVSAHSGAAINMSRPFTYR